MYLFSSNVGLGTCVSINIKHGWDYVVRKVEVKPKVIQRLTEPRDQPWKDLGTNLG